MGFTFVNDPNGESYTLIVQDSHRWKFCRTIILCGLNLIDRILLPIYRLGHSVLRGSNITIKYIL